MKPVHVGLLVLGAALAGGLAVRMTQPPPIPVASVIPAIAPVSVPPAVAIEPPVVTERKPSPIPVPEAVSPAPPPKRVFHFSGKTGCRKPGPKSASAPVRCAGI